MEKIIICFFVFLCLYMFIPYILSFWFGVGAFRKGSGESIVAFTFDDGPDPVYTPPASGSSKKIWSKSHLLCRRLQSKKIS